MKCKMPGSASEESGVSKSIEEISSGQQVENGVSSVPPHYWDDDEESGQKPSELYGQFTWKIQMFSKINKRELRSEQFEVGGCQWYILMYPQGCQVSGHVSLFLCVANHEELYPGWTNLAQFTLALVNKHPSKSKYSDTIHYFCEEEHDWGWKKFVELSKLLDGYIDGDSLTVKVQVQVIRDREDRPFHCLDGPYRRELIRVYLTIVEQICDCFVEERRRKLLNLLEDKTRWTSFCAFWQGVDQNAKRLMLREKSDSILKLVVKHFFVEKEVTSTLVMDSLYSGLKALEGQTKSKNGRDQESLDAEELPVPIVRIERDTFILEDNVLLLLERAVLEHSPPADEKGPQNSTEFHPIEHDERRLTELGRRTIEIFVLDHIFSRKIEVAYLDSTLNRQEELIHEEEAVGTTESEQKEKRGASKEEKEANKNRGNINEAIGNLKIK